MRRNTGAILRETRPETIITSAWRGLARKTSEPKRARSLRDEVAFIISMAQQANPNVAGQREDLRAQLINESSRVVNTSGSASAMMFSSPIKFSGCGSCLLPFALVHVRQQPRFTFGLASRAFIPVKRALLDHINVTGQQQADKNHHLDVDQSSQTESRARQCLKNNCPRHEKNDLNVEQDENHRNQVKLD